MSFLLCVCSGVSRVMLVSLKPALALLMTVGGARTYSADETASLNLLCPSSIAVLPTVAPYYTHFLPIFARPDSCGGSTSEKCEGVHFLKASTTNTTTRTIPGSHHDQIFQLNRRPRSVAQAQATPTEIAEEFEMTCKALVDKVTAEDIHEACFPEDINKYQRRRTTHVSRVG